jgi:hypothetical protein
MYSYAWCYQTITPDIVDALKTIYSTKINENYDLEIMNATAVRNGDYLNGEVYMQNKGISTASAVFLSIIVNETVVYEFKIQPLEGGYYTRYNFENVYVNGEFDSITIALDKYKTLNELYYDNNQAVLS